MKRRVMLIATILLVTIVVFPLFPISARAQSEVVTLNPTTGSPGTAATISGVGFAANTAGIVWFDTNGNSAIDAGEPTVAVTTNAAGAISGGINLPVPVAVAAGYQIRADIPTGGSVEASATFTIRAPGITLNPTIGSSGTAVNIMGVGFAVNTAGTVWFDTNVNNVLDASENWISVTTNADGSIPGVWLTVPYLANGTYYVLADIPNTPIGVIEASASVTIPMTYMNLNPSTGSPGTTIYISGNGFGINTSGTIWFDSNNNNLLDQSEAELPFTTDRVGAITGVTLTVPITPSGTYHIFADVPTGVTVEASSVFIVTSALTLNPSTGASGTLVTINGRGFAPNTAGKVWFDSSGNGMPDDVETTLQAVTDTSGSILDVTMIVPSIAPGTYQVRSDITSGGDFVQAQASFSITSSTSPPVVYTNIARGINQDSVSLIGNLSSLGSANVVSCGFEWGTTLFYGNMTTLQNMTTIGQFTSEITGVVSGETYHFRIKAIGDGIALGNDVVFNITPSVTTKPVSGITSTSATLTGYLLDRGISNSLNVSFEYGITSNYGKSTNEQTITGGTNVFTAILTGLTPGQTYHFRAKVVGYQTLYSSDDTFTTFPGIAVPPSVSTVAASNISATRVTFNGNLTAMGTATHVTTSTEYWVDLAGGGSKAVSKDGGGGGGGGGFGWGWTSRGPMTSPGTYSDDISGLTPGTVYRYRTKAVGDGISYGNEQTFTTLPIPIPPTITTGAATNVTPNFAELNGALTDMGSAKIVDLYLYYYGTRFVGSGIKVMTEPGNFCFKVGIKPYTIFSYNFRARGDSTSYGIEQSFTSSSTIAPSVITKPATDVTQTGATLGSCITDIGSAGSDIKISFEYGTTAMYGNTAIGVPSSVSSGDYTVNLKDLAPATLYHFRAKADGGTHGITYGADMTFSTTTEQRTLIISIVGQGSTTPPAGNYTYPNGTAVNITATPAGGWYFDKWTGEVANSLSTTTTVTMNANKTLTANFRQQPNPSLVAIQITPVNPKVMKVIMGTGLQFTATGIYSNGSRVKLNTNIIWASSNLSVATIGPATGFTTPVAVGTSIITATFGGVTASTNLTVTAAPLQSIAITPANPTIAKGVAQQFTAIGTYSDASTADITTSVQWTSSDTGKATISANTGLIQALAEGQTTVTATLFGVSGNTIVTVVSPAPVVVTVGAIKQNPGTYEGQNVRISGTYRGWSAGYGKAPVGRSDFVIEDATGFVYVTGSSMGLRYPEDVGKSIVVNGIVRVKNGVAYIEVR